MRRGTSVGTRGPSSCLLSVGLHHPAQVRRFVGNMFLMNNNLNLNDFQVFLVSLRMYNLPNLILRTALIRPGLPQLETLSEHPKLFRPSLNDLTFRSERHLQLIEI